ncbi:MAG: hypothetical protein HY720_05990 [Planctomycetes bacterium]|nr:hypothetical protein [Planctomycetota bacterium]
MMDVATAIREIIQDDPRYTEAAYEFVFEALQHTMRTLGREGHVRGPELLEGARRHAIEQYGYLARTVLANFGIHGCEDIGQVVFNLVQKGLMKKTDEDRLEDFHGGYDFEKAFEGDFRVDLDGTDLVQT